MKILARATVFTLFALTLVGGFVRTVGAVTPVDATNYSISCDTLTKGAITFKPAFVFSGTTASTTKIKGTLGGCNANSGLNPPVTVISGAVSGLLSNTTNDCVSLIGGGGSTSGTVTIKWKTTPPLTNSTTTVTIGPGDVSGTTATPFADSAQYGKLTISGTTQTGPFSGASGTGTGSSTKSIADQGFNFLIPACSSLKGLKGLNLGPTETYLGD